MKLKYKYFVFLIGLLTTIACHTDEDRPVTTIHYNKYPTADDAISLYIREKLSKPYNCRVIYKYIDSHIPNAFKAVPPRRDVVIKVVDLIIEAWIEPFIAGADGDDRFIKQFFPAEIVLVGSPFYNNDGTIVLGTADSGVRVTLTSVNKIHEMDPKVFARQVFATLFHEFSHIIDQNFNFDAQQFYDLSSDNYTSLGLWTSISNEEAIKRGFVSPYASSLPTEDFAELAAHIITLSSDEFRSIYFDDNTPCEINANYPECLRSKEGKQIIEEKYRLVLNFFKDKANIDLLKVREAFLTKTEQN